MLNTTRQQIQDHPEVNQAFFAKDAPAARVPESNLAIRLQRFTSTLALTGIADRDLALPLKKDLNANLLFLMLLEDYTCSKDCPGQRQFLMRLKLLDFQSGETLYQARLNYQLNEEEEETKALSELITYWNGRLLNRWAADFKTPWRRNGENHKTLKLFERYIIQTFGNENETCLWSYSDENESEGCGILDENCIREYKNS